MKHLGDITKINGAEIEIVDVITGGSPCQDLSIAGKRAGLAGARSGLFMEQVRIVKEMREHDRKSGRTGDMVRPRFMVWENVPGAFSSNKGRDFAAVLEEIIRIAEPEAPDIEVPEKGWPTWGGYHDEVGGRWSVAWRVHDAQYWGVPQRRCRISVVADFGGDTAGEILFERKSVSGHPAESGAARERLAGNAENGASYAVRIRGGCDGGGKGALVQEDKSGTLGTGNDQTIFCLATQQGGAELRSDDRAPTLTAAAGMSGNNQPVVCAGFEATPINLMVATRGKALGRGTGFGVGQPGDPANTISAAHSHGVFATAIPINDKATRWQGGGESRNHDGSGNGLGIGKEGDPSPTLTAGDRHGVMCMNPWDAQSARVYDQDGVWHSLNANENGGMARDSVMCAGFKIGNSEQARSIGYAEEQSPTLNAECGGNKPAVMCLNDQGGNVMGVSHDVSGTLRAQEHGHQPSVLDMSHACDVIRDCGEVSPSLQARMGTGGNQIPLTYQYVTGTLSPGAHAGSYNGQDAHNDMLVCGATPEVAHALRAKASCAYREDAETYPVQNMVVRRLTPMECERLQGYPDGWTDIGEWCDSKGKRHKAADSPRYKALGNSIALPFWDFLAKRISAQYLRPVTIGSLFDGIGGFPLVFERHNGKGTARWASEIEEFPIAVTKLRFGED
jgi:DNA (cytosine-5)-methyltransferase 1